MAVVITPLDIPGAALEFGITGDVDVIVYDIDGIDAAPTKKIVCDLLPGAPGDVSPNAPNAVFYTKRFIEIHGQDSDGTWAARGLVIYKSNNPFSGGPRPYSRYARSLTQLDLPIWQQRFTYDDNGQPKILYARYGKPLSRPLSQRVKVKYLGIGEDTFAEAVDPWVGAIFQLKQGGQPYILVGADGFSAPGQPLRAEYTFLTTGGVPAYPGDAPWYNDSPIPALPPLAAYSERFVEVNGNNIPIVDVVDPFDIYVNGNILDLPGFP